MRQMASFSRIMYPAILHIVQEWFQEHDKEDGNGIQGLALISKFLPIPIQLSIKRCAWPKSLSQSGSLHNLECLKHLLQTFSCQMPQDTFKTPWLKRAHNVLRLLNPNSRYGAFNTRCNQLHHNKANLFFFFLIIIYFFSLIYNEMDQPIGFGHGVTCTQLLQLY